MKRPLHIAVVGSGPSGLAAAIAAASGGAFVTILEQLPRPGLKLLASGGGKCNLTNALDAEPLAQAFGRQWRFLLPALENCSPAALREFFDARGVPLEAEDGFHFFPKSKSARDILNALLSEAGRLHAVLKTGVAVRKLLIREGVLRGVVTSDGEIHADRVILATGGKGYPALGGGDSGYRLAQAAGHSVTALHPGMTGLHTRESWPHRCTGIALPGVETWIDLPGERQTIRRGELLFTHHGVSGPAVIDFAGRVSELLDKRDDVPLALRFFPDRSADDFRALFARWQRENGKKQISNLLAALLPNALAAEFARLAGITTETAAALPAARRDALTALLAEPRLTIHATDPWPKAMVTRGGVALRHIDPATLESRLLPGLFFAGELLDLDGPCGGYNLQWAFSSGKLAGANT